MALRVGVLGMGYMGILEAKLLKENPYAQLVGIVSKDKAKTKALGEELGCLVYDSLEELLDQGQLDGLIVATPNHLHTDPVKQALEKGVHVLVEKPMALSYAECVEMVDLAQAQEKILMVNHTMRFYESTQLTYEFIQQGELGKPMVGHGERTGWEPLTKTTSWKKDDKFSGGHLFHHIHEIDLLMWFFGEVEEVFCYADNLAHKGLTKEDDVILVTLRFSNGALATLHMGGGFRFGEHFVRVSGDQGGIAINQKNATLTIKRDNQKDEIRPMFSSKESQRSMVELFKQKDLGVFYGNPDTKPAAYLVNSVRDAVDHWIDAMRGVPSPSWLTPLMDGTAGRDAVRVAEAASRSARTGMPVSLKTVR